MYTGCNKTISQSLIGKNRTKSRNKTHLKTFDKNQNSGTTSDTSKNSISQIYVTVTELYIFCIAFNGRLLLPSRVSSEPIYKPESTRGSSTLFCHCNFVFFFTHMDAFYNVFDYQTFYLANNVMM